MTEKLIIERNDLKDVSDTIKVLLDYSNIFSKRRNEVRKMWNEYDYAFETYLLESEDNEIYGFVNGLYSDASDMTNTFAGTISSIIDLNLWPLITDYIEEIKDCIKGWRTVCKEKIERFEMIKNNREKTDIIINNQKINRYVEIYKETLVLFKAVNLHLDELKESKKYKLENNIYNEKKEETNDLSVKQNDDYREYEYKCFDKIHIPGVQESHRSNKVIINGIDAKMGDSLFVLFLRLILQLKKDNNGWIDRYSLHEEGITTDPEKFQIFSNLRTFVGGYLIKKNAREFIENNGSKKYRISTHPDFITYDKGKLINLKDISKVKIAEELP